MDNLVQEGRNARNSGGPRVCQIRPTKLLDFCGGGGAEFMKTISSSI